MKILTTQAIHDALVTGNDEELPADDLFVTVESLRKFLSQLKSVASVLEHIIDSPEEYQRGVLDAIREIEERLRFSDGL